MKMRQSMKARPSNTRVQRTRSSPSALRSPLTRCPLGASARQTAAGALSSKALSSSAVRGLSRIPDGGE